MYRYGNIIVIMFGIFKFDIVWIEFVFDGLMVILCRDICLVGKLFVRIWFEYYGKKVKYNIYIIRLIYRKLFWEYFRKV